MFIILVRALISTSVWILYNHTFIIVYLKFEVEHSENSEFGDEGLEIWNILSQSISTSFSYSCWNQSLVFLVNYVDLDSRTKGSSSPPLSLDIWYDR